MKIYLSKQGFDQKPEKSAGVIKSVRSYNLVDITPEELYKKLIKEYLLNMH